MSEAQNAIYTAKIEEYLGAHPERRQSLLRALDSGVVFDTMTWRELSLVYGAPPRLSGKRYAAVFWCGPNSAQRATPSTDCPGVRAMFILSSRDVEFVERRDDQLERRFIRAAAPFDATLLAMHNDPHLTYAVAQAMLERSIVPNMTLAEITALRFDHDAKEKYWCNFFPAKSCTTACGFCSVVVFINGKTIYLDNKTSLEIPRVRRIEPFINLQPLP